MCCKGLHTRTFTPGTNLSKMRRFIVALAVLIGAYSSSAVEGDADFDFWNPYNLTDCRNETAPYFEDGGRLRVQSWHIHYTTNESDMSRFYYAFIDQFGDYFPPSDNKCPFGPNYGLFTYKYICSLEDAPEEEWALDRIRKFRAKNGLPEVGDGPWTVPQRAFFIPYAYLESTWAWAQDNVGHLDVLLHPNTGCMHDDHSIRAQWVLGDSSSDPTIEILNFPCNVPATGCNDTVWDSSSCGCDTPLNSDAPQDSCVHCTRWY